MAAVRAANTKPLEPVQCGDGSSVLATRLAVVVAELLSCSRRIQMNNYYCVQSPSRRSVPSRSRLQAAHKTFIYVPFSPLIGPQRKPAASVTEPDG